MRTTKVVNALIVAYQLIHAAMFPIGLAALVLTAGSLIQGEKDRALSAIIVVVVTIFAELYIERAFITMEEDADRSE